VIQPARIVQSSSPLLPSREERNRLIDQGIQATGIDFSKVGQFIVVLGPAPPGQPRPRPNPPRPRRRHPLGPERTSRPPSSLHRSCASRNRWTIWRSWSRPSVRWIG
jgi:hypothetical protein